MDPQEIRIDFDGIETRVARVPIEADNISRLTATKTALLYVVNGAPYYSRQSERRPVLTSYSLKDRRASVILDNAGNFAMSRDQKKLITNAGGFAIYDVAANAQSTRKPVSLDGLQVDRVPREEWEQIFDEVWRRYRDFFYVENMHGYDWEALRDQYKPLLEYVAHRSDLNYVIGEMISELNVSTPTSRVATFRFRRARRWRCRRRVRARSASGRYKISKIFQGENEEEIYRSPLTEIGVDVKVGDYVLAIDGEELRGDDDPYRMLRNKADRPVTLTVAAPATGTGATTCPIARSPTRPT